MNARFRARLILLVVSIAATAGLTIWGVHHSWDRIRALEQRLASGFESFRLAGEFQDRLFSLNHSMRHFVARRDARAWSDFDATSVLLDRWLEEQSTTLQTERERDVFRRLNEAYDEYITAARRLPGSVRTEPDVLADADLLGGLEQREQRLIGLVNQLNEAHREAEDVPRLGECFIWAFEDLLVCGRGRLARIDWRFRMGDLP